MAGKTDFEVWCEDKPRQENGKIDGRLLISESRRRGYCVCPKPMRAVIDFTQEGNGFSKPLTCAWCHQPETRASYDFYYGRSEQASS